MDCAGGLGVGSWGAGALAGWEPGVINKKGTECARRGVEPLRIFAPFWWRECRTRPRVGRCGGLRPPRNPRPRRSGGRRPRASPFSQREKGDGRGKWEKLPRGNASRCRALARFCRRGSGGKTGEGRGGGGGWMAEGGDVWPRGIQPRVERGAYAPLPRAQRCGAERSMAQKKERNSFLNSVLAAHGLWSAFKPRPGQASHFVL